MNVIVFNKELDALEQAAFDSLFVILSNLIEYRLSVENSECIKESLLTRFEKVNSTIECKVIFQEVEEFFIKNYLSEKNIQPSLALLFKFFKKKAVILFYNFLKSIVSDIPVRSDLTESKLSEAGSVMMGTPYYSRIRNNFIIAPSERNDIELDVLKDYWFYVLVQLNYSNKDILDIHIYRNFLERITFETFEKKCVEKLSSFIPKLSLSYRENVSGPLTKNYLLADCLKDLECDVKSIERIDMLSEEKVSKVSELLTCIIDLDVLKDPVLTPDGYTYSREGIERWVSLRGTEPMTRNYLSVYMLRDNKPIRALQEKLQKTECQNGKKLAP